MHQHPLSVFSPFILDGGLATELESQGHNLNHSLWSAKLLLENPQAIVDAHLAYLQAGAKCVISASYQASIVGFMSLGLSEIDAEQAIILSVELARDAVEQFHFQHPTKHKPIVAASVGPYGAYLANGSEYTGEYQLGDQELTHFHERRMQLLSNTSADVLACETIPSQQEANVLSSLIKLQEKPAWVSFSCKNNTQISDGNTLGESAKLLENNDKIIAVGINCTSPQYLKYLIPALKKHTTKDIIVYPNSGECFHADSKTWHGSVEPMECAQESIKWHQLGASIIGGCCRMGPEHIRAMVTMFANKLGDK